MIQVQNIHSLTDFVRNTRDHVQRLKETGAPEVLTVNGRAEIVVQDASRYQELLDRLERAELVASLREAARSLDTGEGIPAEDLKAEMSRRYGV